MAGLHSPRGADRVGALRGRCADCVGRLATAVATFGAALEEALAAIAPLHPSVGLDGGERPGPASVATFRDCDDFVSYPDIRRPFGRASARRAGRRRARICDRGRLSGRCDSDAPGNSGLSADRVRRRRRRPLQLRLRPGDPQARCRRPAADDARLDADRRDHFSDALAALGLAPTWDGPGLACHGRDGRVCGRQAMRS